MGAPRWTFWWRRLAAALLGPCSSAAVTLAARDLASAAPAPGLQRSDVHPIRETGGRLPGSMSLRLFEALVIVPGLAASGLALVASTFPDPYLTVEIL